MDGLDGNGLGTQNVRTFDGRKNGGWNIWACSELWVRQPLLLDR